VIDGELIATLADTVNLTSLPYYTVGMCRRAFIASICSN
jgi:hypothetical protein